MKSGKSLELIARVAPYAFAKQEVLYIQPTANTRDERVRSRLGIDTEAIKVASLRDVHQSFDVVGIDEIHMFDPGDVAAIDRWLRADKSVFISGLDLDYRAQIPPIMQRLLELKPDTILPKLAVCDVCHGYTAQFTQIVHKNKPVLEGLPLVIPENGTYDFQARCRRCFVKKENA